MKILDSTKTLSALLLDTTNGLGQIQPLSCIVSEELNGKYECEFTVPTTDKHYNDLKTNGLIRVEVGDGSEQIFRIYSISEPINFVVEVKAQHITYDLSKIPVKPFSATGAVNAKNQMLANIIGSYDFTMSTDITNTTSAFTLDIPRSFRECLGGYEGSLLDVFRGEYQWDNLEVKMLARRGADNNVRISYGKNLTDFRQEQNNENVYDAVYGYAVVDEVTYEATSIYNKTGATYPKVLNVDFSSRYEPGDVPTGAELLSYATAYATNNDIEVPNVNIEIGFVPLWQSDEYKDFLPLERVSLGDTVHVYFDKLGVEASARVIKTEWNVLTKKYDSIELGSAKASLNTVINESVVDTIDNMDIEVDVGWLDDKIQTMTGLIANGLGLHISQDSLGRIILHNEEDIATSQYQYMITSQGFMLSEDYGQTWSSGWDISGNAVLNSLSTITLKALEIYGSYIEGSQILFGDSNDKYILAQVYNDGNDDVGVTFDGTGYVRFRPQQQFVIDNIDSNSQLYNRLRISGGSTYYMEMINYKRSANEIANELKLNSSSTSESITVANHNHNLNGIANRIYMNSDTSNSIRFSNNKIASADNSNEIALSSGSTREEIEIANGKWKSGSYTYNSNYISLQRNQTDSMIYVRNRYPNTNNDANHLLMFYESGYSSVELANLDSNGSFMNYLQFNKGNDNTARLYAQSDLRLMSGGAVRVSSAGGQDIVLDSNDDLHLNYGDKLYINGKTISLDSSGYVKWSS